MIENYEFEKINAIGRWNNYLEFIVFFAAIFNLLYFNEKNGLGIIGMGIAVAFVLFSRVTVISVKQKAILRLLKNKV